MNAVKKRLLTALFVTVLLFAACFMTMHSEKANASTEITSFKMLDKAQARVRDGKGGNGLRFMAEISAKDYDTLYHEYGENLEFGIILTVKDYVEKNIQPFEIGSGEWSEYIVGGENNPTDNYYLRGRVNPAPDENDVDGDGDMQEMVFMFSITEIKDYNFSRVFVAKAYYTVDGQNFVYADTVAERSVFTVASKALAAGAFDGDDMTEANEYFTGIVDDVLADYELNVAVTDEEGMPVTETAYGDVIKISASAVNGDDILDAGVTVTDADGKFIDNGDGTYTVAELGDLSLKVKAGETEKTVTVKNKNHITLDPAKDLAVNGDETLFTFTESDAEIGGRTGVYNYAVSDTLANNELYKQGRLVFDNELINLATAGRYIVFDVYITGVARLVAELGDNFSTTQLYSIGNHVETTALEMRAYYTDENGRITKDAPQGWGLHTGTYYYTWWTVALKIKQDFPESFSLRFNQYGAKQSAYIDNVRITTALDYAELENEITEIDPTELAVIKPENADFEVNDSAVGGRTGVYVYSATVNGADANRLYIPYTADALGKIVKGNYFSFDVYMTEKVKMTFRMHGRLAGQTALSHYILDFSSPQTQVSEFFDYNLFNSEGTEIDVSKYGVGDFLNEWITVRVEIKGDSVNNNAAANWTAFAFDSLGTSGSASAYLDNILIEVPNTDSITPL